MKSESNSKSIVLLPAVLLALPGLSCAPRGPVAPAEVGSPPEQLVIDPVLSKAVGVPANRPPRTTVTEDGRLKFVFFLQNQTDKQINLRYTATFLGDDNVPVYTLGPLSYFLSPAEIRPVEVTANSRNAKDVLVQVGPYE